MNFDDLALSSRSLDAVRRAGYAQPTPIQAATIPVALGGRDLIACASTGTGKTAAFILPILELGKPALILAPTRELAAQIRDSFTLLGGKQLRTAVLVGGLGMGQQTQAIRARPQVIIATPGRLIDHLERHPALLDQIAILVLDEADRMLDMGFAPQVRRILSRVPKTRQTMLFSATMPGPNDPKWKDLLAVGLKNAQRIAVDRPQVARKAEQSLWMIDGDQKAAALLDVLAGEHGSVLVFTRTKHRADRVAVQLNRAGHRAARIHGNRSQAQRQSALDDFKGAKVRILVATDIAARGIDVEGVAHVVNYDLPNDPEDYVHRVGRTARAERSGRATSFVLPAERSSLKSIERLIGQRLPVIEPRSASL